MIVHVLLNLLKALKCDAYLIKLNITGATKLFKALSTCCHVI